MKKIFNLLKALQTQNFFFNFSIKMKKTHRYQIEKLFPEAPKRVFIRRNRLQLTRYIETKQLQDELF